MSVLKFSSQFDEIFINWIITIFDAFHRKLIISQVSNYDRIQIININTWELGQAEREESRQKPVRMLRQELCSVAICQTTPSVTKYGLNWRHCIVTSSHCLLSLSLSLSLSPIPRHSAISARTTQFPDWRLRVVEKHAMIEIIAIFLWTYFMIKFWYFVIQFWTRLVT